MDEDLMKLVREVAELPTADETPGVAADCLLDDWICLARSIVTREDSLDRDGRVAGKFKGTAIGFGDRVRFKVPRTGAIIEGKSLRWRKDPRSSTGGAGFIDVLCDDGRERSVKPSCCEKIEA